jgi:pimeloyl-ACP methyl ester carboxylesterase
VPTQSNLYDQETGAMIDRRTFSATMISGVATSLLPDLSNAQVTGESGQLQTARNVVLVHGAFADGSSWSEVIARLQRRGLKATAVQNPLTSLADDVEATRRILALQDGPTVLAGHSWGGTVISEAGVHPKVAALVYVSARAPDAGEDYAALAARFPKPPASAGIVASEGFAQLSEEAFLNHFAGDIDPAKARILYAVQGRISTTLFASKTSAAAWRSKPTWYAVSTQDRTTAPELQRFLANRMKAKTIEVKSSHLSMLSHPDEIANLITTASGRAGPG